MGYKQISGVEFECDNCGTKIMTAGETNLDGSPLPPKGWFEGSAFESSGDRSTSQPSVDWMACKASCVGNAVRKMIDLKKPESKVDRD